MGKVKDVAQDWLDDCGYDLGYTMETCPPNKDWNIVSRYNVKVWEYYGKTHKQYYGGK
tara:strand:- start:379 stop:552 length:174 start_codon:yes stop_codon:yes gene_type:complete